MMRLVAVVEKADLVSVIEAFTPLRIVIDERRGRAITLARPRSIELVRDRGLRVRGEAHVMWDVAGVPIPITLQQWQLLLVPRVATSGETRGGRADVLTLEPVVEQLDLRLVPGFIDDRIAEAIREALADKRDLLAWRFARTLSKRLPLPPRIGPARWFSIVATDAAASVTEHDLRVAVRFEARVERAASGARGAAGRPAAAREPRPEARPAGVRMR